MAAELEIDAKIKTADTAEGLGQIKKSLRELVSLQEKVGAGSAEFDKLRDAINRTEGKISELSDGFQTLRGSGVERLRNSFGLLKEGFEGFDGGKLKVAFQGIGSAMSSIPIFLIIQNFEKLIEIGAELVEWFIETTSASSNLNEELKELKKNNEDITKSIDSQITALTGLKANEEKIVELKKEKIRIGIEEKKLALEVALVNQKAAEAELSTLAKLGTAVGLGQAAEIKRLADIAKAREETKKATQELEAQLASLQNLNNETTQKQIDNNKKISDERRKEEEKRRLEEEKNYKARIERAIKEQDEVANIIIARAEEEEKLQEDAWKELIELQKTITDEQVREGAIRRENDKKELDDHIKLVEAKKNALISSQKQALDAVQALYDLSFAIRSDKIKKGSKEEEAFAKKQFDINKKLQIAQAVASGLSGIINILGAKSLLPEPFASIQKGVQAASLAAITAANVAKIERMQFDASKFSQGDTGGNSGGGGSNISGGGLPPIKTPDNNTTVLNKNNSSDKSGDIILTVEDFNKVAKKVKVIEKQAVY